MLALSALERFLALFTAAVADGTLVKLTLGKPRAPDSPLRNVFVRPVTLRDGPRLCFVYRETARDVTKNLEAQTAAETVRRLLAEDFFDAHLFTPLQTAQLEQNSGDPSVGGRLRIKTANSAPPAPAPDHDRAKIRLINPATPWLRALGVTTPQGRPREGMTAKFRQIERFAEILQTLLTDAGLTQPNETPHHTRPLEIADMGAGKGYLTFALAELLRNRARITGVERRADLVAAGNRIAAECGLAPALSFVEGEIGATSPAFPPRLDALIALHACDTATDDALAAGHAAGARLLIVSPCCQKELRPRIIPPTVLTESLRHGIFLERHAEFLTDALRALLLEAVGYRTRVLEFVSPEATAKNLLIAALRPHPDTQPSLKALAAARTLAAFYGVREQRLARNLGLDLA